MRKMLGMLIVEQLLMIQMPVLEVKAEAPCEQEKVVEEVSPRIEEFKWYYRTYNGKQQKRLWSITEQKWVTDWIDC